MRKRNDVRLGSRNGVKRGEHYSKSHVVKPLLQSWIAALCIRLIFLATENRDGDDLSESLMRIMPDMPLTNGER